MQCAVFECDGRCSSDRKEGLNALAGKARENLLNNVYNYKPVLYSDGNLGR